MSYISKIKNLSTKVYSYQTYFAYDDNNFETLNKIKKNYNSVELSEIVTNIKKLYYKDIVLSKQNIVEYDYIVPIPYNNEDFKNLNIEVAKQLSEILGIKLLKNFFNNCNVPNVDIRDRYVNENDEINFQINKKYLSKGIKNILFVDMYCSTGKILATIGNKLNKIANVTFLVYNIRIDATKLRNTYIEEIKEIENDIINQVNDGIVVKIKGLFDKKDVTVDLRNSISIVIGENGIGKSTAYRIATLATNHTYEGLLGLLSYPFKEILIFYFDKNQNCYKKEKIIYSKLLPKKKALKKIFENSDFINKYEEIFKDIKYVDWQFKNINKFLDTINEKEYNEIYQKILTKNPTYKYDIMIKTANAKINLDCERMAKLFATICEKLVISSASKRFLLTKDSLYLCLAYSYNLKEFLPPINIYDPIIFDNEEDDIVNSDNKIKNINYQDYDENIWDNILYGDDDYNDEYSEMSDSYYVPEDNIEDEYLRKDEEEYDSVYYDYYDDIEYDLNDYVYSDKNEKKEKEEKHNDSSDNHQYFDMKKISGSKNERPSKINYSKYRHNLLKNYIDKIFANLDIQNDNTYVHREENLQDILKNYNINLLDNHDIEYFQFNYNDENSLRLLKNYYKPRNEEIDVLKDLLREEDFELNKIIKFLNSSNYNYIESVSEEEFIKEMNALFNYRNNEDKNNKITRKNFIDYIYKKIYNDFNYAFFINLKDYYQQEFEGIINNSERDWGKAVEAITSIIYKIKNNSINNILKKTEKYINKYLVEKKITIYPTCVIFSNDNGKFIPCQFLSSGEKNLVLLFFIATMLRYYSANYKNSYNFILDEPEISMNIDWQEDLIEDLKNCLGDKINLTILTQSPQLVQNEHLHAYLHNLSNDEIELDESSSFEIIQIAPFDKMGGGNNEY